MLAGNRAGTGELGDGLRAKMVEATQNATASGGEFALAVNFGGNCAESAEERRGLVEDAGESGSGIFFHDNYTVIMTSILSMQFILEFSVSEGCKCECGLGSRGASHR